MTGKRDPLGSGVKEAFSEIMPFELSLMIMRDK